MLIIRNKKELVENASTKTDRKARGIAITALEQALSAVDPEKIMKSKITLKRNKLRIHQQEFDLKKFRRIFVVGGGKASGEMAEALEEILGRRISAGIVNIPHKIRNSGISQTSSEKGNSEVSPFSTRNRVIKLHQAGHPIPDEAGLKGTKEILNLVSNVTKDDLVLCLISGGGSSLMPLPRGEIALPDIRQINDELLKSGATINEINTVRKHISDFKGGWLAKRTYPATVVNLVLSDVIGDPLEFIASGPTVPDSTTFGDAIDILKRYNLWKTLPSSAKTILTEGQKGLVPETPKEGDRIFKKVYSFVIGNNHLAALAACKELQEKGLQSILLTSYLEGEARHVGTMLASIAKEIHSSGNPLSKPCGIVAGGETTVAVTGNGKGGRNQEVALSAALKIAGMEGSVIATLATDGVDGPTEAAGAIVDGFTIARALKLNLDPGSFLDKNDSYNFFSEVNDHIVTGSTDTNVNDLAVIVVL
jgi:glycerate-2-kinase